MNRLDELERKLAQEVNRTKVSPGLEARLLNEFDRKWGGRPRQRATPRPSFFGVYIGAAAALAASLLLVAFWPKSKPVVNTSAVAVVKPAPEVPVSARPVSVSKPNRKRRAAAPQASEPQFMRIPYTAPLASYERAEIVRVDMPVSALMAAGFHIATPDAGARAQADLVIGEDGMAHAVRLISISSN